MADEINQTAPDESYYLVYPYNESGARGRVVRLIERHARPRSRVVDLGAGAGVICQPLQERGFDYFGLETHPGALRYMSKAGINSAYCDLTDLGQLEARLNECQDTGVYCLLDVIEHLSDPQRLLNFLNEYSLQRPSRPMLVVSVPNVTHYDLGLNLLLGRWDVREAGLLDAEHVRFFTPASLAALLANCGWELVEKEDYPLPHSDQHQPALLEQLPAFDRERLQTIAQAFNPALYINQFVWILRPVGVSGARPQTFWQALSKSPAPLPPPAPAVAQLQEFALRQQKLQAGFENLQQEYQKLQAWAAELSQNYRELEEWAKQLEAKNNSNGILQRVLKRPKS